MHYKYRNNDNRVKDIENENQKQNHEYINNDKVILENCHDLYKLPIDKLKSTKLYNFSGKYFDKIYEEALLIEKEEAEKFRIISIGKSNDQMNIKYIQFEIFHFTEVII
jgi:hypothetical protein